MDVNWRPVFWSDPDEAREVVLKFLGKAHLVKLSDQDLEWLYGMSLEQALEDPCQVGGVCVWGGTAWSLHGLTRLWLCLS